MLNRQANLLDVLFIMERLQFRKELWERAGSYLYELINSTESARLQDSTPENQAEQLWELLFLKERFRTFCDDESAHFTLCDTLNRRGGSCLGITTVFMVLSEAWGLPFRPFLMEGHIALIHLDATLPLIIEPLPNRYCNEPVIEHRTITEHERILTNGEFLAVHLSNRATFVYARAGLMDDAVFLIDSALELFPDYTAGWINRAVLMKKLDNTEEMRLSLDKAKSLNPGFRYTQAIAQIEREKHE